MPSHPSHLFFPLFPFSMFGYQWIVDFRCFIRVRQGFNHQWKWLPRVKWYITLMTFKILIHILGQSWSYGSWNYNYLCNQRLSPLTMWVRILLRRGIIDTTLCDKVCHWLATGRWFSPGSPISSINKTDRNDITETLLKVVLNTTALILTKQLYYL